MFCCCSHGSVLKNGISVTHIVPYAMIWLQRVQNAKRLHPKTIRCLAGGIGSTNHGRGCRDTGWRARIKGSGCGLFRIDELGVRVPMWLWWWTVLFESYWRLHSWPCDLIGHLVLPWPLMRDVTDLSAVVGEESVRRISAGICMIALNSSVEWKPKGETRVECQFPSLSYEIHPLLCNKANCTSKGTCEIAHSENLTPYTRRKGLRYDGHRKGSPSTSKANRCSQISNALYYLALGW
jgi:hypothetical protein